MAVLAIYRLHEGLLFHFPSGMYQQAKSMGVLLSPFKSKGVHKQSLIEGSLAEIAALRLSFLLHCFPDVSATLAFTINLLAVKMHPHAASITIFYRVVDFAYVTETACTTGPQDVLRTSISVSMSSNFEKLFQFLLSLQQLQGHIIMDVYLIVFYYLKVIEDIQWFLVKRLPQVLQNQKSNVLIVDCTSRLFLEHVDFFTSSCLHFGKGGGNTALACSIQLTESQNFSLDKVQMLILLKAIANPPQKIVYLLPNLLPSSQQQSLVLLQEHQGPALAARCISEPHPAEIHNHPAISRFQTDPIKLTFLQSPHSCEVLFSKLLAFLVILDFINILILSQNTFYVQGGQVFRFELTQALRKGVLEILMPKICNELLEVDLLVDVWSVMSTSFLFALFFDPLALRVLPLTRRRALHLQ